MVSTKGKKSANKDQSESDENSDSSNENESDSEVESEEEKKDLKKLINSNTFKKPIYKLEISRDRKVKTPPKQPPFSRERRKSIDKTLENNRSGKKIQKYNHCDFLLKNPSSFLSQYKN